MQLKNELYTIVETQVEQSADTNLPKEARFHLRLHPEHVIYQAHFPGEPITPGVCIVQIGKELLEEVVGSPLEVIKVKNVKFLSVISPKETVSITYVFKKIETSEDSKEVKAQISVMAGEEAKAKVSFICKR